MGNIFFCYSSKNSREKELIITLFEPMKRYEDFIISSDDDIRPGDHWNEEILEFINKSEAAILLLSDQLLRSKFIRETELPLIEKRNSKGMIVFPILLETCNWESIPWLRKIQLCPDKGKTLKDFSRNTQIQIISELTARVIQKLHKKKEGVPDNSLIRKSNGDSFTKIRLYNLPPTAKHFYGRDDSFDTLNKAWEKRETAIITLIASGGVGKTALINEWLKRLEKKNYFEGAKYVLGWSFHSQGGEEKKHAPATSFIQHALKLFAEEYHSNLSPEENTERLADLLKQHKTLLILDGIEPLQHPPATDINRPEQQGRLKEHSIRTLLLRLASGHPGLCVVTSRNALADLNHMLDHTVIEIKLDRLSNEAGEKLLRSLGVTRGLSKDFKEVVEKYNGHALGLDMLGNYLRTFHDGKVWKSDEISTPAFAAGGHIAQNLLNQYLKILGPGLEQDILYMMGLFDRPAPIEAIDFLRKSPALSGFGRSLRMASEVSWHNALKTLFYMGLLTQQQNEDNYIIDSHPVIREACTVRFKMDYPRGWKASHKRLYKYYKNKPKKSLTMDLEDMEYLFTAGVHGSRAGMYFQTFWEIYWKRILEGRKAFMVARFGVFDHFLSALSQLYDPPWKKPAQKLPPFTKRLILKWAVIFLRAVGRFKEACDLSQFILKRVLSRKIWVHKKWKDAAFAKINISEVTLLTKNTEEAIEFGTEAVRYADRYGKGPLSKINSRHEKLSYLMGTRCLLSYIFFEAGEREKAEKMFQEAEILRGREKTKLSYTYIVLGIWYFNVQLRFERYKEIIEEASRILEFTKKNQWLPLIPLSHLAIGQAYLKQAGANGPLDRAMEHLNNAVNGLQRTSNVNNLPEALLARAVGYRMIGEYNKARNDLEKVKEIAEYANMKFFLCDYHLESSRLSSLENKTIEANMHEVEAKKLIEEAGYWGKQNIKL